MKSGGIMNRFSFVALVGAFCLSAISSASAQSVGEKFSKIVEVRSLGHGQRTYIPLPEGEWTVISKTVTRSQPSNMPIIRMYLANVEDRQLKGLVLVGTNGELARQWEVPKDCSRTDIFLRLPEDSRDNMGKSYSCLLINHIGMTPSANASQYVKEMYSWVWANTTGMPGTLIKTSYLVSDGSRFMDAEYYRNPEADGFVALTDNGWRSSAWHRDRLPADAKRLAYMNEIKALALQWRPTVEAGFRGRQ